MSRPETPREMAIREMLAWAMHVAAEPPVREGRPVFRTGIRWRTIAGLRRALEKHGIDWRQLKGGSRNQT